MAEFKYNKDNCPNPKIKEKGCHNCPDHSDCVVPYFNFLILNGDL